MLDFTVLPKPVKTSVSETLGFLVVRCWEKNHPTHYSGQIRILLGSL